MMDKWVDARTDGHMYKNNVALVHPYHEGK